MRDESCVSSRFAIDDRGVAIQSEYYKLSCTSNSAVMAQDRHFKSFLCSRDGLWVTSFADRILLSVDERATGHAEATASLEGEEEDEDEGEEDEDAARRCEH